MSYLEVTAATEALPGLVEVVRTLVEGMDHVQTQDLGQVAAQAGALLTAARGLVLSCAAEATTRGSVRESGSGSTAHWLTDQGTGLTRVDSFVMRRALLACDAPALARLREGLLSGRVTPADAVHAARVHAELVGALDPAFHEQVAAGVADLAGRVDARAELDGFRTTMLARYATVADQDRRDAHEQSRRGMSTFTPTGDGLWAFRGIVGDVDKARLAAALTAFSAPQAATLPDGNVVRDERTAAQRRLDALLTITMIAASAATRGPMGATARVSLVLTPAALLLPCEHRAKDAFGMWRAVPGQECDCPLPDATRDDLGAVLGPRAARELTCGADLTPVWLDPLGRPVDVGRTTRLATARQRRALEVRDGGCSFPGCGAPASWCQAHHITHWADGGATDVDNLALLCGHHHRYIHTHHITGRVTPDQSHVHWDVIHTWTGWHPAPPPNPGADPPGGHPTPPPDSDPPDRHALTA
ncbi:DUF222 domain-containing protein [Arsenicicoccus cauae]|uniref:HNH endonuclease signature motif containing protein n=1 Tax=Arsenicicoccus cauae TaxID=2663847 RepID=UPI00370DC66D